MSYSVLLKSRVKFALLVYLLLTYRAHVHLLRSSILSRLVFFVNYDILKKIVLIFVYLSISFSTERLNKRFDDKRRQFTKPEKEFAFIIYIHVCCLH